MVSAGADVCAINEEGWSVSDVAFHSEVQTAWIEALKYCGIDIKDVLGRPNVDPAYSTALDFQHGERHESITSKVSLAEYLERRKAFGSPEYPGQEGTIELSSSEDDNSEEEGLYYSEDNDSDDEDVAEEPSVTAKVNKEGCFVGNEENHVEYEELTAKGKAKLE